MMRTNRNGFNGSAGDPIYISLSANKMFEKLTFTLYNQFFMKLLI